MKFSVITVVYNDLDGLRKTNKSVFSQTNVDFEWIVCDGGSGDDTVSYLDSLNSNVLWVSEPDLGIYDAMNNGVNMANGDYIVFMNAGDTFYDCHSLHAVSNLLSDLEFIPSVVFGGAYFKFPKSSREIYRAPRNVDSIIWHGLPANHQASYYKNGCVSKPFYDLKYKVCGDYYLACRLYSAQSKVAYINRPLAFFEAGGVSSRSFLKLFLEPYLIQRDELRVPFFIRIVSLTRRVMVTLVFHAIANLTFYKRRA